MAQQQIIATTFNMWVRLKEKAQVYVALHNRQIKESGIGDRLNLGLLINKALTEYLTKVGRK